jgi:DNA-binding MarR family transcriptional regulator
MTDPLDISDCADCLCLASRRAALAITRTFERRLRPHHMRIAQFSMLTNLALRGPMAIGVLAAWLGVERTTLTRNLALVEAAGWVETASGEDARSRIVSLTASGRQKLEETYPAWREAQAEVTKRIGAGPTATLRQLSGQFTG